jgi:ATP-binding cassette subfamily B protein
VRHIPLATLRGAMGFVPQEPFLFSDTIAGNVAFGMRRAGGARPANDEPASALDTRLREASAIARLDKDVEAFPKGYDTIVGERGITLSGGQKQRTALARAVMLNPRILILDDALSAVDTYTEEEILARLRVFMRRRTSIIVAHRVSTVRHADVIVVLENGRIIEQGSHDELVRLGGAYADLHQKQLLQEELAAS